MATVQNTLPTWAAPPVMLQPLSATSRVMKIGMTSDTMSLEDLSMTAYWKIRARLLRVPRRGQRPDLGRAHQGVPGRGRAREARERQGVRSTTVMEVTSHGPRRRPAEVRRGRLHRDRRVHRHARTSGSGSATSCRSSPPEDLAQVAAGRARRQDAAHRRRRQGGAGGAAPRRRRRHQRRPRADAGGREAAVGQHRSTSPRTSRRPSTTCSPGLPGVKIDTTIFRPAGFVAAGHRPPHRVAHPRRAPGAARARPVPLRLALAR